MLVMTGRGQMSYPSTGRDQKRTQETRGLLVFIPWESDGITPLRNYYKPKEAGDMEKSAQGQIN